jgi:hypothetical protein
MIQWHPASGEVIYKCRGNQEKQPNYASNCCQMQKAAASLDVHKERGDFSTPGERYAEPLVIWVSHSQRGVRLAREFETRQRRRAGINILGEREYLKSAPEHFGMQQRLQRAFGLGRIR